MNTSEEQAIAEAATPGPWFEESASVFYSDDAYVCHISDDVGSDDQADATFIAHARTVVPLALEVVKAVQERTAAIRVDFDAFSEQSVKEWTAEVARTTANLHAALAAWEASDA
jgi:hypothetical protein